MPFVRHHGSAQPDPGHPDPPVHARQRHMRVNITNFGGLIQSIEVPDRRGRLSDVSLGFRNLQGYGANDFFPQPSGGSGSTYFGATVGRYANRIAKGTFTLDGTTYHIPDQQRPERVARRADRLE